MTNPKHTDTSRSGDLVERIEGCIANAEHDDEWKTLIDARDRIEALEAEVERLREVLTVFAQIAHETDGIPACMSVNVNVNRLREARAALGEKQ